jgi:Kef-type K+ transport system membrane component KefB
MLLFLLLQILVIVSVARAVGVVFMALGQPRVVGEMVAGILLGPTLFGRVAPSAAAWLFPAASIDLLGVVSQVAIVLFMLLVGLRLDERHLRTNAPAVVVTSVLSVMVPFALGAGYAFAISTRTRIPAAQVLPFVGFVGLSLSITAFPVLVRLLSEHRLTHTRLGAVATACAASGDLAGWVALAFLTSAVATAGISPASALLGLLLWGIVMIAGVRPLLRWVLRRRSPTEGMAVVLVAALGSAAATEAVGMHALFGAFFTGAMLSKDLRDPTIYTYRIEPLTTLLLPVFFALTGLRADLLTLWSADLFAETLLVLVLAIAGKAVAPLLMSRSLAFSRGETLGLAALLNTRGLMELVVLNIGLETGLLPQPIFATLLMMALITTAMTSPLLSALGYRTGSRDLAPEMTRRDAGTDRSISTA